MARIPQETIDRIRENADILDVVGDYVHLKRRGRNWFGPCPFHHETKPSFSVNQQKQIYYCFGCGKGGNAINFIMEIEKVDFVEALQRLGKKLGIVVEASGPSDPRKKATVQQIFDLHELATDWYRKNLKGSKGEKVRAYLEERGITPATQALFKLGYALPSWDQLVRAVSDKKFSHEAQNQSGLFGTGQRGTFDRFRSRIIFPIANKAGRVVAFAGRVFEGDDPAKYLNSPETPIYHKSEVLYGLHLTRDFVRDLETVIIVEGYLDLIQLYQAGVKHVVAISGTALTQRHTRELGKLTRTPYLAYDGDSAGVKAAIRGGYTLLRGGLDPRVVELPADLDPDDWVRRDGPEPFLEAVSQALPLLEFHRKHFEGDLRQAVDLRRFLDESLQELASLSDPLTLELALKQLAAQAGVDERRLRESLQARPRRVHRDPEAEDDQAVPPVIIEPSRANRAQQTLIALAFSEDEVVLNLLADQAEIALFRHDALKNIWQVIQPDLRESTLPDVNRVLGRLAEEPQRQVLSRLVMSAGHEELQLTLAIDCLTVLLKETLNEEIADRRRTLHQAEKEAGPPPTEIIRAVTDLQHELTNVEHRFDKYRSA